MYNHFKDHYPISDQSGTDLVSDSANSLAALRDSISVGGIKGWNYATSGGTTTQRDTLSWYKIFEVGFALTLPPCEASEKFVL